MAVQLNSKWEDVMSYRAPSGAKLESLESRRLLSVGSLIDLIDAPEFSMPVARMYGVVSQPPMMYGTTRGTIPTIRRTYSGAFNITTPIAVSGTFKLVVRKEESRGTFASLRGTLDVQTNQFGNLHGDMTYGKIRDNWRINMNFTGTAPPFTAVVTGKSNSTGSQLKGQITVTTTQVFTTTFVL